MSLLTVVIVLIVIGALLWFVNTYLNFIDAKIMKIINVVVIIVVVLWLASVFGLLDHLHDVKVPRV